MLYIDLDRDKSVSLIKQLYYSIRNDILDGTLSAEERLPSTRELAKHLNISRNVVIESYEQLTMAEFIREGFMDLHIKKMKKIYLEKRNILINCFKKAFGNDVVVTGAEAGMHLVVYFKNVRFTDEVMKEIRNKKLEVAPASMFYLNDFGFKNAKSINDKDKYEHMLVFGYGNTEAEDIEKGIEKLYKVLKY